jgi:hypothetical protein
MPRTKKTLSKQNLAQLPVLITDTGSESRYFNIKQLSGVFTGGRNAFLIAGTSLLKPNTEILVEITDVNGNSLYVEAIRGFVEAGARMIVVEVYENTPPGVAILTIVGTARINAETNTPIPEALTNKSNVRWQKRIIIEPRNKNTTPIRVKNQPQVFVEELITTQSSLVRTPINIGVNFVSKPIVVNKKQSGYIFINYTGTSFASFQKEPKITGSLFLETRKYTINLDTPSSSYQIIEQYTSSIDLPIKLQNASTSFAESNITDDRLNTILNITPLLSGSYEITSSAYSASNTQYIQTVTSVKSQLKYNYISESISIASESLSLAKLRIVNLDTVSGQIYRVKTSNKSAKSQLEYESVADTPTLVGEILVTGSSIINNREASIGQFINTQILTSSWYAQLTTGSTIPDSSYYTGSSSLPLIKSDASIIDGAYVQTTSSSYFFGTRNQYEVFTNSEYTIKFTSYVTGSTNASVDVYLVGSAVATNNVLGQKIGTLTTKSEVAYFPNNTFNFNVSRNGSVGIRFVVNSGRWQFSDVSLKVAEENAFSPDEVTLILPNNFKYDDLLEYKTEFFDINNNAIGLDAISEPTAFIGSRTYVLRSGDNMYGKLTVERGGIEVTGSSTFAGSFNLASGSEFYRWGHKLFNYGNFISTASQAFPSTNTAYSASLSTTIFNRGIKLVSGSRITVENDGYYNLQFSAQLENTANNTIVFDIWFAKNQVNIANSATKVELTKQPGTTSKNVAAWNYMEYLTSGSYIEIRIAADQTSGQLTYETANAVHPGIPSLIVTMDQIA